MKLDDLDKRLLDVIQSDFPLESRPFDALSKRVGSTEQEILERLCRLERQGYVRELGAIFDLRRLGYTSTLCAARVTRDALDSVVSLISAFPEVTHNYLREHDFNVWFTVIARSQSDIDRLLCRLRAQKGVAEVLSLPQRRLFKINVHFAIHPNHNQAPAPNVPGAGRHEPPATPPAFQDWEIRLLRVLSDPLPLLERPFAAIAQRAEVIEELALERVGAWVADGTIRRFGARIAHQAVGYPANGMSAWKVLPSEVESAGRYMSAQPEVSHCYLRDTHPSWEYNLYAMIHGASRDAVKAVAQRIADHTRLRDHALLFSSKEVKKAAPRYFAEDEPVPNVAACELPASHGGVVRERNCPSRHCEESSTKQSHRTQRLRERDCFVEDSSQ